MVYLTYLLIGTLAGVAAGAFGIGGGIVLVPILVWGLGMSQHQAQGTSLATFVLPVGILGAFAYYRANPFPLKPPFVIALGLLIGALIGGTLAQKIPERPLQIAFGVIMILAGTKLILGK